MIVMFLFFVDESRLAALDRGGRNGLVERHVRYRDVLEQRATVLATRGLQPGPAGVTVHPSAGGPVVRPGSAAPPGHSLAGFYLVECTSMEHAVELGRMYPMPEGLGHLELRPVMQAWDYGQTAEVAADAATVWRLYADVAGWPSWQVELDSVVLDGPLAAGAAGTITFLGEQALPFRIVQATEGEGYISETEVAPGSYLRMEHQLASLPDGRTRVTHQATLALDRFGLDFRPRFYVGLGASLRALAEAAAHLPQDDQPAATAMPSRSGAR